jgi:hypothetical protein
VRFNHISDEEACGLPMRDPVFQGELACLRTKGHAGVCIARMNAAGDADGVWWCCRVPLGQPHTDWCVARPGDGAT